MGKNITLKASDGHEFSAYRADPAGKPKGCMIVIQEIFGVNDHIRSVADRIAANGYLAVAPAMQDRAQRPRIDQSVIRQLDQREGIELFAQPPQRYPPPESRRGKSCAHIRKRRRRGN